MTYPNGRVITRDIGSSGGNDDALSRIRAIKDGSLELAVYSYLGQSSVVQVDYTEPDLRFDLAHGTGDDPNDGGLDRFDRVIDLLWRDYGSSTDDERVQHGYDRAGNRLWRRNPVDTNNLHDELYSYDGLYRLRTFKRGTLNGNRDAITTLKFAQDWGLDETGNWSSFKEDDDGDATWDLEQSRTHNKVNEISSISESTGPSWVDPAYNRVGNTTTIPKPADPTGSFTATYDAWDHLVKLVEGANTVAEYAYDGRHFRVVSKSYTGGSLDETRHHFYTTGWQCIEDRVDSATTADRHWVWGVRYIDDLILRDRDTDENGTLDERLYILQDDNWNACTVIGPDGLVLERYDYAAYGAKRVLNPSFAYLESSDAKIDRTFGAYHEYSTRLHDVRHRDYQSVLGSWSQRDPIDQMSSSKFAPDIQRGFSSQSGGANLYDYGNANPIAFVDPVGTRCGPWTKIKRPCSRQDFKICAEYCKKQGKKHFDVKGCELWWRNCSQTFLCLLTVGYYERANNTNCECSDEDECFDDYHKCIVAWRPRNIPADTCWLCFRRCRESKDKKWPTKDVDPTFTPPCDYWNWNKKGKGK